MAEGKASCERVLFSEKTQVMTMCKQMAAPESDAGERKRLLKLVTSALEKYLEQPHLLDPHLEDMMAVVMGRAKELVMKRESAVLADAEGGERGRPGEAFPFQVFVCPQLHDMFCVIYQLCRARGAKAVVRLMPHEAAELEPVIHALEAQDTDDFSTWETRYGLLLWLAMLSLVPFDIDTIDSGLAESSRKETVPGCGSVETEAEVEGEELDGGRRANLVGTILSLGRKYLEDAGPTRDAAAACLSSLLTRPDMEASHLRRFLEWSASVLESVTFEGRVGRERLSKLAFLVMGVMNTLASLFKQGHREKLVGLIPVVFDSVVGLAELGSGQTLLRKMLVKLLQRIGTTYMPPRVATWRYSRGQRSLLQSLASTGEGPSNEQQSSPEQPQDFKDKKAVGEGGERELSPRVNQGDDGEECDEGENKGGTTGTKDQQQQQEKEEGGDDEVEVPEELEDIVDALLCGLRDRDTVVRWSAAKGIGRITERLPHELGDDVVCSVLDLFVEAEWDGAWHGGCLALAELARRGLLLPERLPRACPLVRRALAYDVRRGAGSVGAHVRDAACYVCWAFARAYSPRLLGPHLPGLCDSMLSTALFDREINVRRAAAAAFQENVGRQGQYGDGGDTKGAPEEFDERLAVGGVAHGIAIITAADYFALGNRQQAYLEISTLVASFERYRRHLVDSLRLEKLYHWDPEIRRLSATALGNMAPLDPAHAAEVVLPAALKDALSPELLRRHGACLALSEVTLALGKISYSLSPETVNGLLGILPALEKARLYRGRGGELMRQAACRVVECLALTRGDVPVKTQLVFLDAIDATLKHPLEHVQQFAVAALKAVLRNWFPVGTDGPSERLQKRTTGKYVSGLRTDDNPAVTRGYALALGVLPRKLAGASRAALEDVLEALKDAAVGKHGFLPPRSDQNGGGNPRAGGSGASGSGPGGEPDAETRRNAVRALTELCEEVGVGRGPVETPGGGFSIGMRRDQRTGVKQEDNDGGDESSERSRGTPGERSGEERSGERFGKWSPVRLTLGGVEGVLSTLLAASEDYFVDSRGDVGSWSRMEALTSLEKLTRLAARASRALPFLDCSGNKTSRKPSGTDPEPFLVPAMQDRLALVDLPPAPVPSPHHPCDEVYLTPSMVERALCAVLKQLSEKLDAVRERAGTVLQKMVESGDPSLPFVPEREALKRAMEGPEGVACVVDGTSKGVVNWASPSTTFPIVVGLLAVPEYHDAIVAGLVISVGGLTESVVKSSSNALLRWIRACKSAGNKRAVAGVAVRLVAMFGDAGRDPRVVIPLLKTIELLLSNECFDFLSAEDHTFAVSLWKAVTAELKGCRDVKKACLGASVLVCLLDYEDPARVKALRSSVFILGHRFPNVRKTTAEALYLKLLANETIVDEAVYDEVLDLLTCSEWDGDLRAAKEARSAIAGLLGLSVPTAGVSGAAGIGDGKTPANCEGGKPRKADELESYESLVKSTGY